MDPKMIKIEKTVAKHVPSGCMLIGNRWEPEPDLTLPHVFDAANDDITGNGHVRYDYCDHDCDNDGHEHEWDYDYVTISIVVPAVPQTKYNDYVTRHNNNFRSMHGHSGYKVAKKIFGESMTYEEYCMWSAWVVWVCR